MPSPQCQPRRKQDLNKVFLRDDGGYNIIASSGLMSLGFFPVVLGVNFPLKFPRIVEIWMTTSQQPAALLCLFQRRNSGMHLGLLWMSGNDGLNWQKSRSYYIYDYLAYDLIWHMTSYDLGIRWLLLQSVVISINNLNIAVMMLIPTKNKTNCPNNPKSFPNFCQLADCSGVLLKWQVFAWKKPALL